MFDHFLAYYIAYYGKKHFGKKIIVPAIGLYQAVTWIHIVLVVYYNYIFRLYPSLSCAYT